MLCCKNAEKSKYQNTNFLDKGQSSKTREANIFGRFELVQFAGRPHVQTEGETTVLAGGIVRARYFVPANNMNIK